MEGKRFLHSLSLQNILSYGGVQETVSLEPLNVLIGPNASGKSNFIEAINILRAAPSDLTNLIHEGGGMPEWLWKGSDPSISAASIKAIVDYPPGHNPLSHEIAFYRPAVQVKILQELIHYVHHVHEEGVGSPNDYWLCQLTNIPRTGPQASLNARLLADERPSKSGPRFHRFETSDLRDNQSILSQFKDPERYPEMTYLGEQYARIGVFRASSIARSTELRKPQPVGLSKDYPREDGRNLVLVLDDLINRNFKSLIIDYLKKFYWAIEDLQIELFGDHVLVFLSETGLKKRIPAKRLSDGTLHYLFLLTLLCHPEPPPLVCIEEPELGIHPDIIPTIAELLIDASKHTQLIVTTHSEILVSALSEVPESILVCERDEKGTHLRRLEAEPLKEWLKEYSLGQAWLSGEIGGTRW